MIDPLMIDPLTIEQSASRASEWAWAEGRLYEVLGAWAKSSERAACKLYFDACSQHHAWRAGLWRERLAGRPELRREPGRGDVMAVLAGLEGDAGRLGAYCRVVLARSVVGYRSWQDVCSPSADRPVARALSIAVADVLADWQEGARLLVEMVDEGGEAAAEAVAAGSAGLERSMAGRGFW